MGLFVEEGFMELATKQYRVSIPGKECRKCVNYKRPLCKLTGTYTWEKNHCEDYERKTDLYQASE